MLSSQNSLTERIISFFMTLFGITLIILCIIKNIPHDFWGVIKFIYSSVI